jgi:hypothetical protein
LRAGCRKWFAFLIFYGTCTPELLACRLDDAAEFGAYISDILIQTGEET